MENAWVRVKVDGLKPGMGIQAIVGLSAEYSYLDSKRATFLKERFRGANVTLVRNGKNEETSIDGIASGDQITEISELSMIKGLDEISETMAILLKKLGFLEFLVMPGSCGEGHSPNPDLSAPTAATPATTPQPVSGNGAGAGAATSPNAAPSNGSKRVTDSVPVFASARGLKHKKTLAQARYFLECVEEAGDTRFKATETIQDMFHQSRSSRFNMKPAHELVETILRKDIKSAMSVVSGLKSSDQTYAHCVDMAMIFNEVATSIIKASGKSVDDRLIGSTLAAGFMHDIGKSKVPQDILDSTERFAPDSKEMELMRSHVEHSAKILTDIGADKTMINVALYHHVKKDTSLSSSYPKADYAELMPMTRLAAITDVYQALTGKRSYKKNWVPGEAVEYLRSLEGTEFDEKMMSSFLRIIGKYPVGSLVRLSTGDLAFVTKVEGQPLDRPVVALVENALGEILSANPIADLVDEQDISIVEVVDHYEHYDASIDQPFEIFKALRLV